MESQLEVLSSLQLIRLMVILMNVLKMHKFMITVRSQKLLYPSLMMPVFLMGYAKFQSMMQFHGAVTMTLMYPC